MAKYRKKHLPPGTSIEAPKTLICLMQAFHVDSEQAIKALIVETEKTIYGTNNPGMYKPISKDELDCMMSLMKGINPKDDLETLYAAQFVLSHMLGMRKLTIRYKDDQKIGLDLLKFGNEAIQNLEIKRNGACLTSKSIINITVKEKL